MLFISDDPSPARKYKLYLLAPSCSSKGALFQSQGHVFLFGITTIIFILSTTGLILSIALTSQYIPFAIHTLDRSFDNVWSLQKMRVVSGITTAIAKLNACFTHPFV
jgi:hypothetical protein